MNKRVMGHFGDTDFVFPVKHLGRGSGITRGGRAAKQQIFARLRVSRREMRPTLGS